MDSKFLDHSPLQPPDRASILEPGSLLQGEDEAQDSAPTVTGQPPVCKSLLPNMRPPDTTECDGSSRRRELHQDVLGPAAAAHNAEIVSSRSDDGLSLSLEIFFARLPAARICLRVGHQQQFCACRTMVDCTITIQHQRVRVCICTRCVYD